MSDRKHAGPPYMEMEDIPDQTLWDMWNEAMINGETKTAEAFLKERERRDRRQKR